MIIESERIKLRDLNVDDAEDMFEYTSIPEVSKYVAWNPHKSISEDKDYIEKILSDKDGSSMYFGIDLCSRNKLIGCVHVYNNSLKHRRAEISYILSPNYWGKGYATEAVQTIIRWLFKNGYRRVQALCIDGNIRSERLMVRCGMSYEGTLKNYAILNDGQSYSMKIYSICQKHGEL